MSHNFRKVFGIPRGGTLVAVMLSHECGLPMVTDIDEYDSSVLVVDDIVDSGDTIKPIDDDSYFIASLYCRENTTYVFPSFWAFDAKDYWVVFPWEINAEQRRNRTYIYTGEKEKDNE